jgi:hypothetical protein
MNPASDAKIGVAASGSRIGLVARQTLAEALRLQLTVLLAVVGAGLVLLAFWLRDFNFGAAELKFIADLGLGVMTLSGMLLAALGMAHLFFRDLDGGVAGCVLTRRLRRGEYLTGKLAGVAALLALFTAGLAAVLAAVLAVRKAQLGATFIPISTFLQACALVWLKMTLVAAMTLFVCSYARSALFASSAGLMLAVVAHLRPFTAAEGWLAWLRLWPNLGLFDPEPLLAGAAMGFPQLLALAGYWAVFMILFGWLSSYVFHRREL